MDRVAAEGGRVLGQATTRSINALFSLKSYLPFDALPVWSDIRGLPVEQQQGPLPRPGKSAPISSRPKQECSPRVPNSRAAVRPTNQPPEA